VQAYFRPELLNRLDEIVVFKQLSMRDTRTIAELLLADTEQRMAVRGIGLRVTAPLMRLICHEGYNQVRPLDCILMQIQRKPW
jgi:ATP-dependent Clp protease ATP-binding subunit ClpC